MGMRDWKLLAQALAPDIPETERDRILPPLDGLEAAFRPLAAGIPGEVEPAVVFFCPSEERPQ